MPTLSFVLDECMLLTYFPRGRSLGIVFWVALWLPCVGYPPGVGQP